MIWHDGDSRPSLKTGYKGLAAAVVLMLAACGGSSALPTFDLYAPREIGRIGQGFGQLTVNEPLGVQIFDTERIVVKEPTGAITYVGGAQWVDRLPRLMQTRLIETFENANQARVGRPGGGLISNTALTTEIRAFQVDAASGQAVVEISAKIVGGSGRVISGRLFSARVPVDSVDGPTAARALDQALSQVMIEIVRWVSSGGRGA